MFWLAVLVAGIIIVAVWTFYERQSSVPHAALVRERTVKRAEEKGRKPAPILGVCASCGRQETLPFRCKYCGQLFCHEHRLPERHKCDGVKAV